MGTCLDIMSIDKDMGTCQNMDITKQQQHEQPEKL